MNVMLSLEVLDSIGAEVAILSAGRYALPVRFRIRGPAIEARIPTWSGIADWVSEAAEITLVALGRSRSALCWVFIRGTASLVPNSDWSELQIPPCGKVSPDDLYQLLRIEPTRIELVDENRGWGFRETIDR